MAKVAWNAGIKEDSNNSEAKRLNFAKECLSAGRQCLEIFGPEGDDEGPFQEMKILQTLLNETDV